MLDALRDFMRRLGAEPDARHFAKEDARLALAALLVHAVSIDGVVSEAERVKLRELLGRNFGLSGTDLDLLIEDARAAEGEAVDLYGFTSVLKQRLDVGERERLVGMMWQLVYADGKVHEFEDNLIWRAAELLGVSSDVRIRLKQAARGHGGA